MSDKKSDFEIKIKNYFVLASIIILVFVLILTINDLNYYIRKSKINQNIELRNDFINLEYKNQVVKNPRCLIVFGENKKNDVKIVEECLKKSNISYISKEKFEYITKNELNYAEIIIINGNVFNSVGNTNEVLNYIEKGKHIIFTSMPDINNSKMKKLKEIMGIKNNTKIVNQKGMKFLPGFMLGGLLKLPELSYKAYNIELLSTTKTYATDLDNSALIWRNIYNKSEIYVVNGPFFETNAGYGILSFLMSEIYRDYIYPVVNAKVITYSGLPYFSNENTNELLELYNRDAIKLQHDILIPDILSINKSRNLIPNGFITNNFHKKNNEKLSNYNVKQINSYEKFIYKSGGEVGVVYSGDLKKDFEMHHKLFDNKNLKFVRLKEEYLENVDEFNKDEFSSIEAVIGPWTKDFESFGYFNKKTIYIPFTIDNIDDTDLKKLEFYSAVTAFGAIVHNFNIEQIVFPEGSKDNWMNLSRNYVKSIDSYRSKFEMIESRNISETIESIMKFMTSEYLINYFDNRIEIRIKKWQGEVYYFLRTNKEIKDIRGGTIEKIEEGVYLVTAKNKEVDIILKPIDRYE